MLDYNIQEDLEEQTKSTLAIIQAITVVVLVVFSWIVFDASTNQHPERFQLFVGLILTTVVTEVLRRNKRIAGASLAYTVGTTLSLGVILWNFGPDTLSLFWFIIPIAIANLTLNTSSAITMTCLSMIVMVAPTAHHIGFPEVVYSAAMPLVLSAIVAGVIQANTMMNNEMVYWASDSQQKAAIREEKFFKQREQLAETTLELTKVNSRLEMVNKQLEESRAKVEQVSQAKTIFLSNMSHELRTPLNVVIGYSSSMLRMPEMYDNYPLPDIYRNDIELIMENGQYLVGLINDILDLSKIEAGKLELNLARVNMLDIFKGVIATCVGLAKDKSVQIMPDYPDDLPWAWADPLRVRQIILNLMSNAIKFTDTGSVTLSARKDGDFLRISVIDTGIGIPETALATIFDRFQQAQQSAEKQIHGTGLGLDISQRLTQMHGGEMTLTSEVNKGSTFTFTIPLAPVETQVETDTDDDTAPDRLKIFEDVDESYIDLHTILLVEDEVNTRNMLRRSLESDGYVVIDTHDGEQVLELASGLIPSLIVLDVRLPNMEGWDILKSLKANAETSAIPVIVHSAYGDRETALRYGAAQYVQKPVTPEVMSKAIQSILSTVVLNPVGE